MERGRRAPKRPLSSGVALFHEPSTVASLVRPEPTAQTVDEGLLQMLDVRGRARSASVYRRW